MKNFKGAFIALGLLLALGFYIKFFEKGPVKAPDEAEQGEKIFKGVADDVTGLTVEFPADKTRKTIQLSRVPPGVGNWYLTSPLKLEADESTLRSLLNGIAEARLEADLSDAANPADFGLDNPVARYTFLFKDGANFVLETGSKNVNGQSVYVRMAGRKGVGLLPSYVVDALGDKPNFYRKKTLFKVDASSLRKFRITRPGMVLTLEKGKEGAWSVVQPVRDNASEELVRQFLTLVDGYRINEFTDDAPASLGRYGLSTPQVSLEVWPTGEGPSRTLYMGKVVDQNVFVKTRDLPFVAATSVGLLRDLEKKAPNDFKAKDVMKFSENQAVKLVLRKGSKTVTYEKGADGTWKSVERPSAPVEAPALLAQLASTMVLEFIPPGVDVGLAVPSATAEVILDDKTTRVYKFGKRKDDRVYLASDKSKDVYLVASYVLSQIEGYLMPAPPSVPTAGK